MSILPAWLTIVLALAAYRVWRLLAEDKILDRPRHWLLDRVERSWGGAGEKISEFLSCPWCAGAWIVAGELVVYTWIFGWFGAWSVLVMWFAISTLVGGLASVFALADRWNG